MLKKIVLLLSVIALSKVAFAASVDDATKKTDHEVAKDAKHDATHKKHDAKHKKQKNHEKQEADHTDHDHQEKGEKEAK